MSKYLPLLYLLAVALVGGVLLRLFGVLQKGASAVVDTAADFVAPSGTSPLSNPVSEWFGGLFKSDAEKAVDAMLSSPPAPVNPNSGSVNIGSDQGVNSNPMLGPQTTVGRIPPKTTNKTQIFGPAYTEASTSYSGASNPSPPVNDYGSSGYDGSRYTGGH